MQLGLIGDIAEEFGGAAARRERQAEGRSEALAQPPAYRDPNPQGRFHLEVEDPARLRENTSRRAVSPRTIRIGGRVKLQSAVGGVTECEVKGGDG